ncbi:MAG TPA: hypothetical protein VFJ97_01895 [Dermatophilaceae bacterium]|nr:hypothetical protein [Dermatophilaceae bacterium]
MAKALLGQREFRDDRLLLETARLRTRVRDLETLIDRLQRDNDRLRAGMPRESVRESVRETVRVPEPVS